MSCMIPKQKAVQCKYCKKKFRESDFIRHAANGCEKNPDRVVQKYTAKKKYAATKPFSTKKHYAAPWTSVHILGNFASAQQRIAAENAAKDIAEKFLKPKVAAARAKSKAEKRKRSDDVSDDETKPKFQKLSDTARNARLARFQASNTSNMSRSNGVPVPGANAKTVNSSFRRLYGEKKEKRGFETMSRILSLASERGIAMKCVVTRNCDYCDKTIPNGEKFDTVKSPSGVEIGRCMSCCGSEMPVKFI